MKMIGPACPECGKPSLLTKNRYNKYVWKCADHDTQVGCHPGTTAPLGSPAGPELRHARSLVHMRFDRLWRDDAPKFYGKTDPGQVKYIRKIARPRCYAFLAHKMGISREDCHVGMFDIERCRKAWVSLRGVSYDAVREWSKTHDITS